MSGLYDLHTHTTLTDGEMIPIELVRRMAVLGYSTVAITDHADSTNLKFLLESVIRLKISAEYYGVRLLCGVELTHIPPPLIAGSAREARNSGADLVIVHGESPVEPVAAGTNHAACTCSDVNVLAHPGFITSEDAYEAHDRRIALEITSRGGHNRTNGHVVSVARDAECLMVVNSDAHAPRDLLDKRAKFDVARGAGLTKEECARVMDLNIDSLVLR
ncbi:MAG: histidinol phosphate phosphatase domain-containing protein [Methanoregulaceae archaeon]|jgi:histidinol phosphatase-like PHP family hydrolase|nr:histidinol phosphate phosphatase domain-containing protein [Methanoregulaceae archaeon]